MSSEKTEKSRGVCHYLEIISKEIEMLKSSNATDEDKLIIVYRGESRDYGNTRLMPSLFRKSEYVEKEKYLYELLTDYNVIHEESMGNIGKAIQAQHYVSVSRMLDITYNVLTALFFACDSKSNLTEDAYLYIFGFPYHFSPHSQYIEDYYNSYLIDKKVMYSKNFKVVTSSFANERISAQRGGFIFFPGKVFNPINEMYYRRVKISNKDKKQILAELKELFDVDRFYVFPEIENRADYAKDRFDTQEYRGKEFCVKSEIDYAIERIKYENLVKINQGINQINRKRWLRKEREDLQQYMNSVKEELTDFENCKRNVADFFEYLELI